MEILQLIALGLDVLLVAAAIMAYLTRPRIGGELARGLGILLVGVMILGLAHLLESILFVVINVGLYVNEVVHRLFVGFGFVWVIVGFVTMNRAFRE
ncbi:MAG: hypothetical protein HY868_20335 [Chloroflexi bacterium]|nr:hypothetical protein [Chloroflexota bacterium]